MTKDTKKFPDSSKRFNELLEYFEKGKAFTEELMQENSRLRMRALQLEKEKMEMKAMADPEQLAGLIDENKRLKEKLDLLEGWHDEMERENKDFANRYLEIQSQNDNLLNLYVASYQLHSTLDSDEVVVAIEEIVLNLIGAEEYYICMMTDNMQSSKIISGEGPDGPIKGKRLEDLDPVLSIVLGEGRSYYRQESEVGVTHLACIPMKVKDDVVGAISISKLLDHKKEGLTAIDHELLTLLADHAATALVSSNLYSRTKRRLNTVESFVGLLELNGKNEEVNTADGNVDSL